jgi:hypothetical protein
MAVRYILGALAVVFLIAGTARRTRIQGRTWPLVRAIFAVVSIRPFHSGS